MKVTFCSNNTLPITVEEYLEPTSCTWSISQDRKTPSGMVESNTIELDEYTAKELIRTLKFILHRDEIEQTEIWDKHHKKSTL